MPLILLEIYLIVEIFLSNEEGKLKYTNLRFLPVFLLNRKMRLVKAQFLLVVVGLSGFAQPSPQRERGNELMDLESMGKKAAVLNKTATDADVTPMGSESTSTVKLVAKTNSELLVSTAHQRNLSRQSPQTFSELDTATNEAQDAATEVLDRGGLPSDAAMNTPHIYEGQVKVCETYSRYAYPRWYKNINFSQYGYSYFNEENSSLRNTVKVNNRK